MSPTGWTGVAVVVLGVAGVTGVTGGCGMTANGAVPLDGRTRLADDRAHPTLGDASAPLALTDLGPTPPPATAPPPAAGEATSDVGPDADPDDPPPAEPPADTSTDDDDGLELVRAALANAEAAPSVASVAIEDLLDRDDAAARALIAKSITSVEPRLAQLVIEALSLRPGSVPQYLDELVAALATVPDDAIDALGLVLARQGGEIPGQVAAIAEDSDRDVRERRVAIDVLGIMASISSAQVLMRLADPESDPTVHREAMAALGRMSGLDLGMDYAAWTTWWAEAKTKQPADWWRDVRQRDRDRIARQQADIDALSDRIVGLLRSMYVERADDPEAQSALLPAHLSDELRAVRRFAIGRVERLIRDSVPIPPKIREQVATMLGDEAVDLRMRAVRVLDDLDAEGLEGLLITRLPDESDPAVSAAMLDVLGRRRTVDAIPIVLDSLGDAATSEAAARAASMLVESGALISPEREQAADLVRPMLDGQARPDAMRLLATIGDDDDVAVLTRRLRTSSPSVAGAIAQGLAVRRAANGEDLAANRLDPLMDAADVPAVRAVLIDALAAAEPTRERMFDLLAYEPTTDDGADPRAGWRLAVTRLAQRMSAIEVLAVDDVLATGRRRPATDDEPAAAGAADAGTADPSRPADPAGAAAPPNDGARDGAASPATDSTPAPAPPRSESSGESPLTPISEVREMILAAAVDGAHPVDQTAAMLERLASMYLTKDRPDEAWSLLAGREIHPSFRDLMVEAALRTAHYAEAATIEDRPTRWLDTLEAMIDEGAAERAQGLRDQIDQRFDGRLDEATQQRLAAAGQRLSADPGSSGAGQSDGTSDDGTGAGAAGSSDAGPPTG